MNINAMRNVVVTGQIATLKAQIEAWQIYHERTDEDVTEIITALEAQITALEAL